MERFDKETIFIRYLTLLFGVVLLMTDVFFLWFGITYDIPAIRYLIYVKLVINTANIFIILKKHYLIASVIIYSVIMAMMVVGIISLGTAPEFQLYAVGMLVCISYNSYLHKRQLKRQLPLFIVIAIHVLCYLGMYVYALTNDPIYTIPQSGITILIAFNSAISFSIVILYASLFYYVANDSEEKLEQMALIDQLTGLYNRHYLIGYLDHQESMDQCWLAIMDVDDFKKVNDTYGHNCGDYILRELSRIAKETCAKSTVCRWGGEEFIFFSDPKGDDISILETLRKRIEQEKFEYEGHTLQMRVTIGGAVYEPHMTKDSWISQADARLYTGKKSGKNQVVLQS